MSSSRVGAAPSEHTVTATVTDQEVCLSLDHGSEPSTQWVHLGHPPPGRGGPKGPPNPHQRHWEVTSGELGAEGREGSPCLRPAQKTLMDALLCPVPAMGSALPLHATPHGQPPAPSCSLASRTHCSLSSMLVQQFLPHLLAVSANTWGPQTYTGRLILSQNQAPHNKFHCLTPSWGVWHSSCLSRHPTLVSILRPPPCARTQGQGSLSH